MNNDYDRDDDSHISLDEQILIDTELNKIHRMYDELIERVYLMGYVKGQLHNNLTLQEVNHVLKALETMSNHDIARAREQISEGVVDHLRLVQKLQDYKYRLQ